MSPVNHLYSVVAPVKEKVIGEDHLHLTPEGVEAVAGQTANIIAESKRAELKAFGKKIVERRTEQFLVQNNKKQIYPNDPCICGSGKKYKRCCGRK